MIAIDADDLIRVVITFQVDAIPLMHSHRVDPLLQRAALTRDRTDEVLHEPFRAQIRGSGPVL